MILQNSYKALTAFALQSEQLSKPVFWIYILCLRKPALLTEAPACWTMTINKTACFTFRWGFLRWSRLVSEDLHLTTSFTNLWGFMVKLHKCSTDWLKRFISRLMRPSFSIGSEAVTSPGTPGTERKLCSLPSQTGNRHKSCSEGNSPGCWFTARRKQRLEYSHRAAPVCLLASVRKEKNHNRNSEELQTPARSATRGLRVTFSWFMPLQFSFLLALLSFCNFQGYCCQISGVT